MKKNNKGVIVLLIVIIVMLVALCVLFATGTINFKTNDNSVDNINNQENTNGNNNVINDTNDANSNIEEKNNSNNQVTDNMNFIREKRITLIEEPNCTGQHSTPLVATIEPNGNITIAQDGGAVEIEVGNAKYLYKVVVIACDNVKLYYITENNDLYVIERPDSVTLNQKSSKVIDKKVVEFLGNERKNDDLYLKVLLEDKTIDYIKYFSSPN